MPTSNINLGVYNAITDTSVQDALYSIHGIQDSLYTFDGNSLDYIDGITGTNAYGGEVFAVNPYNTKLYVGSGRDVLYYDLADEHLPLYNGKLVGVIPSGKYIQCMFIPPGGGHLYIGFNGGVLYCVDVNTLAIQSTQISAASLTSIASIVSSWDSKFLYILGGTSSSNGQTLWVYRRDKLTGVITLVQNNPITYGGIVPIEIRVNPDNSCLAVAFASEIYVYDITSGSGRLNYRSKHLKGARSIHSITYGA